jgi:hypothetical protein
MVTTYVFAGSSLSVGFGICCAPFGVGALAAAHPSEDVDEDVELDVWATAEFPLDACAVAALRPPLELDPHAANTSPAAAVIEQHSSLCAAREWADIRAA